MPQKFLSIKNFNDYQHYKERNPPWIKLHVCLLDDPAFLRLSDASKWQYIGLLLLASRHENSVPFDIKYIKDRLGLSSEMDLSSRFIKEHVLASRKQDASTMHTNADSEKRQRRDREETESDARGLAQAPASAPNTQTIALPPVSDEERLKELNMSKTLSAVLTSIGKAMP